MIETRAPGKLFVAGEYAVVEPGGSAVLVAVDRFVRVRVRDAAANTLRSDHYTEPLTWRRDGEGVAIDGAREPDVVGAALDVVEALAAASGRPELTLDIAVESDLDHVDGAKFGLGSSGAVVVALVHALATAHDLPLDDQTLLRLALLATWRINPSGSGGDVAASTLGGWLAYRSADAAAALALRDRVGVAAAVAEPWPGLLAEPLPTPGALALLVGWTGSPASTAALVERSRRSRAASDADFRSFFAASDATVASLADAIRADDTARIETAIRSARAGLGRYAALSGIEIETPALTALCDLAEARGAAAKSSGAGGGDCGIALAGPDVDRAALAADWSAGGIRPLDLAVVTRPDTTRSTP
ncbi:phosphomevalonate kinase [Conyzicola lurida]|uniref:Phosphomevalonate kinase n=1 Tax=Conyzicola lurida TaxID=1172621 RepID=A0A841AGC6_9MICO|nr:phosphomevalonate kinase [Conyzicola lurida]MBB5842870.1 phosphomevalonate kinase [Conyzicola lurida]